MYKIVQILPEGQNGTILEYLVELSSPYATDEDYYNMAYRNAVEDSEIDPDSQFDFKFIVINYIEN